MLFTAQPRAHKPQQMDNELSVNACDRVMVSSAEIVPSMTAVDSDDLVHVL